MKGPKILIVLSIASMFIPPLNASESEDSLEEMVGASVGYWNRNFESLKENALYSKLNSQFGDANVLVTLEPSGDIVGIDFENSRIVDYEIGKELPESTVDVKLRMSTFRNVFYADDPTPQFLAAYRANEIEIKGRTLSAKLLFEMTDKLKTLVPVDSEDVGAVSEDSGVITPQTDENVEDDKVEKEKPGESNFIGFVGKSIAKFLGLFGR